MQSSEMYTHRAVYIYIYINLVRSNKAVRGRKINEKLYKEDK